MRTKPSFKLAVAIVAGVTGCDDPATVVLQPLSVYNWVPASGAVSIDPNTRVLVTFSDDIVTTSLTSDTFQLRRPDGGALAGSIAYDKSTYTASFAPAASLDFGSLYTISLGSRIEGVTQGALLIDLSSSFETVRVDGSTRDPECLYASDCPGTQLCSHIGTCIDRCVTERDCLAGQSCQDGDCI